MSKKNSAPGKLAPIVVRLAALWVLAGAAYKLFSGSPNDLPPIVRDFFLGPDLTFRLAIAIELSICALVFLRPRIGWWLLAAQFAVFLAILVQLILSGASSCGCFGSKVTITPATMFTIDGLCLLAMLATRPWKNLPEEPASSRISLVLAALLAAWVAPFTLIESAPENIVAKTDEQTGAWQAPEKIGRYAALNPDTWVGKDIHDTELAAYMNVDEQILDGTWILYRVSCDHCARYLKHLADTYDPMAGKFYTYVRLSEEGDEEAREVDPATLAYGMEAILPTTAWVITPPWRLELEGGIVTEAVFEGDFEERLGE